MAIYSPMEVGLRSHERNGLLVQNGPNFELEPIPRSLYALAHMPRGLHGYISS